jgi:hypothetical protein
MVGFCVILPLSRAPSLVSRQHGDSIDFDRSEDEETGTILLGGDRSTSIRRSVRRGEQRAILALNGVEGGDEDDREVVVGPQNRRQEDDFRHHSYYPFL